MDIAIRLEKKAKKKKNRKNSLASCKVIRTKIIKETANALKKQEMQIEENVPNFVILSLN